jgi:hypothetical protein
MMSKNAWSPGRIRRSEKLCGWGLRRSPEKALIASTSSEPSSYRALVASGDDLVLAHARLEQREGDQLVARPLADVRAGEVAHVVHVEDQQRAEVRGLERRPGAAEAVGPQAGEVEALLPVHLHRPRAGSLPRATEAFSRYRSMPDRRASMW